MWCILIHAAKIYIYSVIYCTFEIFSGLEMFEIVSYMCFKGISVNYVKFTSNLSVVHQLFLSASNRGCSFSQTTQFCGQS